MLGLDVCTGELHVGWKSTAVLKRHKANWTKITHFKIYIRSTGKTLYYDNVYITIYFVLRSTRPNQNFFGVTNDYPTFDDIVKLYH